MTKRYTVIYTDYGDSCDGFARVLGTYKTKEIAKREMDRDIKFYQRLNHHLVRFHYSETAMVGDELHGCQWQILEMEV